MSTLKGLKFLTLAMFLGCFIAAGTLTSCRDQKKEEKTEAEAEHPGGDEHPTKDGEEHPTKDGDEHPTKDGDEHPTKDGDEHPTKDGE